MDVKKYYKLKLCRHYESHGKCDKGNSCTYAHGIDDLKEIKKENCFNGLDCFKKDCQFEHPESWNSENNKKICEYYVNSYCKKEDMCRFKHVKNAIEKKDKNDNSEIKENEDIDINDNNNFPYLKENTISNIIKTNNIWKSFSDTKEKENNIDEIKIKNQDNGDLSPNIEVFVNGFKYNNEYNIKTDRNKENVDLIIKNDENKLLNSNYDYESDFPKLSNINVGKQNNKNIEEINIPNISLTINGKQIENINEIDFEDSKKKINEKEIYNKVINDEKLMYNYKKHNNNSNNETLLNVCETNIQIMNKYLNEHIDIIKNNFDELMIETRDQNFLNYCINTQMLLNSITINSSLLERNFRDYKYFLQKNKN